MCGSPPSPPPGPVPGNPPGGNAAGTGPCCACPANGDINTNGFSNYFTTTYSHSDVLTNKGKIAVVRTEEGGTVHLTKSFSLAYSNSATEADHKTIVAGALSSAMSTWQQEAGNYRIVVEQTGCKPQKLKILYTSKIVASGADVAVTVDGTVPPPLDSEDPQLRSFVTGGTAMNFFVRANGDNSWTMVHEVGHTFGLPDEYIYDHPNNTAPSVTYKGASDPDRTVTLSASGVDPETPGTFAFDNSCIMGQAENTVYFDYLFFWVAIEVQKVLKAAGVSAVVKVETV
jgi:hypothetical protein